MKITWYGHSAFLLAGRNRVLVDPFITGNEKCPIKWNEIECDIICITHGHGDHIGDSIQIAKRNNATVVTIYEIAEYLSSQGVDSVGMNIGGTLRLKDTSITMVQAHHSPGVSPSEFKHTGGVCAFIIDTERKVYHMGDTGIFSDIKLIREIWRPEIIMVPIGDLYTMGPSEAALAVSWLAPEYAIPMHYNTWPPIERNPEEFKKLVNEKCNTKVIIMEPGETVEI